MIFLLSLLLLFSANLGAEQLNPNTKIEEINQFHLGLNTLWTKEALIKGMSPSMSNMIIDEDGLKIRNGFQVIGTTDALSKIDFMAPFIKDSGETELIMSDSVKILTTRDFINFTLLKDTQASNALTKMAHGRNKALLTNGSDPALAYDGTAVTVLDGQGGRANVPRGKFAAFYHDRFWVCNTTANNSECWYSRFVGTDGARLDPLIDRLAWAWGGLENQLNIGRGDGKGISGMSIQGGQLKIHKDNQSIYTIFGDDESNYFPVKTDAEVGTVSHDSIVDLDGVQYYIAKEGIYATDGRTSVKISDLIYPDIEAVVNNLTNIVSDTWDTQANFANKKFSFGGTTATSSGFLVPIVSQTVSNFDATQTQVEMRSAGSASPSTFTQFMTISTSVFDAANKYTGWMRAIDISITGGVGVNATYVNVILRNHRDLSEGTTQFIIQPPSPSNREIRVLPPSTFTFTMDDILNGDLKIKLEYNNIPPVSEENTLSISSANTMGMIIGNTTGSYVSEVTTDTSLTVWDTFESVYNTNGGAVSFYVRSATSGVIVPTQAWTAISPGTIINFPAHRNYIQWTTTITAVNPNNLTEIDNVEVNHLEGGSADTRPIGIPWKGRYLLSVTTETAGNRQIIYVKSRLSSQEPKAFARWDGINIKSWTKMRDNFYAGSSTAGVIFRMDYGTNDGGSPIIWHWQSPSLDFDKKFFKKQEIEWWLEADALNGATINIDGSFDDGEYTTYQALLDGTGRVLRTIKKPRNYGKYFNYRLRGGDLDKLPRINSLNILYTPTDIKD